MGVITKPTQTPKLARALRDSSGCAKRSNGGEPAGELRDPHLRVHPGDSPLARATPAPIVQILQALTSCRASRTARGPDSHGIHARMRPSAAVCARQRWWVVGSEGGGGRGAAPCAARKKRTAPQRAHPARSTQRPRVRWLLGPAGVEYARSTHTHTRGVLRAGRQSPPPVHTGRFTRSPLWCWP